MCLLNSKPFHKRLRFTVELYDDGEVFFGRVIATRDNVFIFSRAPAVFTRATLSLLRTSLCPFVTTSMAIKEEKKGKEDGRRTKRRGRRFD